MMISACLLQQHRTITPISGTRNYGLSPPTSILFQENSRALSTRQSSGGIFLAENPCTKICKTIPDTGSLSVLLRTLRFCYLLSPHSTDIPYHVSTFNALIYVFHISLSLDYCLSCRVTTLRRKFLESCLFKNELYSLGFPTYLTFKVQN